MQDYTKWKSENDLSKWKFKYYKGLGTNTSPEAKAYFGNISQHEPVFRWRDEPKDGQPLDKVIHAVI